MINPVNKRLLDLFIRHGVFIERYKTSQVNKIIAMFNDDVLPDIERLLYKHLGRETITAAYVKALSLDLRILTGAYTLMNDKFGAELVKLAISDADWLAAVVRNTVPISIDFTLPSPAQLKALASKTYVRGKLVKDWFANLEATTRDKIVRQVNIGMVEGQNVDQIVRRIKGTQAANYSDGILNASRHELQNVVGTSISSINSAVTKDTYAANSDIIKGEFWNATLDSSTCEACAALDGQEFELGEGPQPPLHWGPCRCRRLPIIKSWKELGINLKEAPEGTRASMDGQVPASTTYGGWLRGQSIETQNEVLGVGKAQIFRRGEVPINRFIDARNRPLTLGQLVKLETQLSNN